MTATSQTRAAADGVTSVWEQVCRHCDGIAVGSTMAALAARGGVAALAARECQGTGELQRTLGARPGYLRVALRLLADQGWLRITGSTVDDDLTVEPTRTGMTVLAQFGHAYGRAPELLAIAADIEDILSGTAGPAGDRALSRAVELMRARWNLPDTRSSAAAQVAAHLDGHVVAPVMSLLSRRGVLRPGTGVLRPGTGVLRPGTTVHQMADIFHGGRQALNLAVEVLRLQGWAVRDGDAVRLTPAGLIAMECAPQYWHPVSYVPLLRDVPALLYGGQPVRPVSGPPGAQEEHQDRELDIRFSGQVFARTCRAPFLEVVLPLFDQHVDHQPSAVVDIGCGDGTLLTTLYHAVRARTRRGGRLGSHPLRFVGAEPSAVARKVAARRLDEAGVPGLVTSGDITDPRGLGGTLAEAGIDPRNALYVCKSVIHDRPYLDPGDLILPGGAPPHLLSTFADPSGASIPARKIASSLAVLFRSWREPAARHGFAVIEAHSADPAISAALAGRTMATSLDATHGYSHQYPVTPEAFSWAARAGGFVSRAHREPGASLAGYTPLTIDHFVVAKDGCP